MSEAPRRKRFQIHLSTALILMIATEVLMWVNIKPHEVRFTGEEIFNNSDEKERYRENLLKLFQEHWPQTETYRNHVLKEWKCGFPAVIFTKITSNFEFASQPAVVFDFSTPFNWSAVRINVVIVPAILFAIWFVCEWWIRRRAARTGHT